MFEDYRWEKKTPKDGDYSPLRSFLDGLRFNNGVAEQNFLLANANIPQIINYAAVTALAYHTDSSAKNFYFTQDATTGRWEVLPWDLDHTWGATCCNVNSTFVTPAEPGDQTSDLMVAILAVPEWRTMYFRRLRTLVDQILAPNVLQDVFDAKIEPHPARARTRSCRLGQGWVGDVQQSAQLAVRSDQHAPEHVEQ